MPERSPSRRRLSVAEAAVIVAFIAFCGVLVVFVLKRARTPTLTIYTSLPSLQVGKRHNQQSADTQRAIQLALEDAGGEAGGFKIKLKPLDSSNPTGEIDPETIADHARAVAKDSKAAVYIGDFTSDASITSIPILFKAGIPQVSPGSTRVGLTIPDPYGDFDEPDVHYPVDADADDPDPARTFVRVAPNDNVQATALTALMQHDGCTRLAIVYDGGDYSDGLTNNEKAFDRPRRVFRQEVRPKAAAPVYQELARLARSLGADCFQYAGSSNPNTVAIFRAFMEALPGARLYATDGVSEANFTRRHRGLHCVNVSLMVPPRKLDAYQNFVTRFKERFNVADDPDPYAVYGYEAMSLALSAIDGSKGKRTAILRRLHLATRESRYLGGYSIDENGDTTLVDYDVTRIDGCKAATPVQAVPQDELSGALDVLKAQAAALLGSG